MKRKYPLQLFEFHSSKLSCVCNFFLSLVITHIQGTPLLCHKISEMISGVESRNRGRVFNYALGFADNPRISAEI